MDKLNFEKMERAKTETQLLNRFIIDDQGLNWDEIETYLVNVMGKTEEAYIMFWVEMVYNMKELKKTIIKEVQIKGNDFDLIKALSDIRISKYNKVVYNYFAYLVEYSKLVYNNNQRGIFW